MNHKQSLKLILKIILIQQVNNNQKKFVPLYGVSYMNKTNTKIPPSNRKYIIFTYFAPQSTPQLFQNQLLIKTKTKTKIINPKHKSTK